MYEKEALLYEHIDSERVRCKVCQRFCEIMPGEKGYCGTRENKNGTLYAMTYGLVTTKAFSPIETKSVFHFFPGSNWLSVGSLGCNFKCADCQHYEIARIKYDVKNNYQAIYYSPQDLIDMAKNNECKGIAWAYNEPTMWFEYVLDSARLAKAAGLYTNFVTNGFISQQALEMLAPYIDIYCVDIKGFSGVTYSSVANIDAWSGVLESTRSAKTVHALHVEIVMTIIQGYNDDMKELPRFADWIASELGKDTPWHIRRFTPCSELAHLEPTPIKIMTQVQELAKKAKLQYVYLENLPGRKGENTFCHKCHKLIVERKENDTVISKVVNGSCPSCKEIIPGRFETKF